MSRRTRIYAHHKDTTASETAANLIGQHGYPDHRIRHGTWPRVQGNGQPCSAPMKRETAERIAKALHR